MRRAHNKRKPVFGMKMQASEEGNPPTEPPLGVARGSKWLDNKYTMPKIDG